MGNLVTTVIPAGLATAGGLGADLMANMLSSYWPDAPHWLVGILFWLGFCLTFIPLPFWCVLKLFRSGRTIYGICAGFVVLVSLISLASFFACPRGDEILKDVKLQIGSYDLKAPDKTSNFAVNVYFENKGTSAAKELRYSSALIHTPGLIPYQEIESYFSKLYYYVAYEHKRNTARTEKCILFYYGG
jgi:hypothetical protein